jgi:hypothetical protein
MTFLKATLAAVGQEAMCNGPVLAVKKEIPAKMKMKLMNLNRVHVVTPISSSSRDRPQG